MDFIAKGTADGKEVTIHGTVGSDKGDLAYKETAKVRGSVRGCTCCALGAQMNGSRRTGFKG